MYIKQKITASFFLLIVAIPAIFSVIYLLKVASLHNSIEERMESEKLQTITLSAEKVYWIIKDKELLIEGELFDVKSYTLSEDSISLTGFFDAEETDVQEKFNNFTAQNSTSPLNEFELELDFLFLPFYTNPAEDSNNEYWFQLSSHYHSFSERIPVSSASILIQPPRC